MTESASSLTERPQEAEPSVAPEPATPRALWPTFMRRTLAEDTLKTEPRRPARD
jgi:hypothetical protein